jgi:hypothetical protein
VVTVVGPRGVIPPASTAVTPRADASAQAAALDAANAWIRRLALMVAGQQLASLAVDHYGLFRLPHRELAGIRLAGVAACRPE